MAGRPPFMNSTGLVSKILMRIAEAQQPPRFTQDYLATKLSFSSGSAKAIIPLLKRIGFLNSDGSPTQIYSEFRTNSGRGAAMAKAMRIGYSDIYERNEYAHNLSKEKLRDLVIEMTGLERGASTVNAIVGTFSALRVQLETS